MSLEQVFDIYEIGNANGFYVGQARRMAQGGWQRRVLKHLAGKGSKGAHRLLLAGAAARCIGSVHAERAYVNLIEAAAWDRRVARGWIPVHVRPQDSELWVGNLGRRLTAEHRANMSAAQRGRVFTDEQRAKMSASHKGKPLSPQHRANAGAARRGKAMAPETRAKLSKAHRGKIRSPEHCAKLSSWHRGKVLSPEHRQKIGAAQIGRIRSSEQRANMSAAQTLMWRKRRSLHSEHP